MGALLEYEAIARKISCKRKNLRILSIAYLIQKKDLSQLVGGKPNSLLGFHCKKKSPKCRPHDG
jgi:hypothetical protein